MKGNCVIMISLHILEVKSLMAKLLTNTIFDSFYLKEMDIQTFTNFHISGQFNEDFFTQEELEIRGDNNVTLWSDVKNIAYAIIKGNKTPLSLKVIFQLSKEDTERMVNELAGKLRLEEIGGLYMNVRFDKGELHIVTGVAIKTFSLDKTLEQEWDMEVKRFLKKHEIMYEE